MSAVGCGKPAPVQKVKEKKFADLQSAGSVWPKEDSLQNEESGFAGESSAQRSLHQGVHVYTQKAQFCVAKSCACQAYQRDRGNNLYPRNRAQSAGALHRFDTRWTCQGPPRGSVPCRAGYVRYCWSSGPKELPLEIWRQAA